jgi:hypothetical protein
MESNIVEICAGQKTRVRRSTLSSRLHSPQLLDKSLCKARLISPHTRLSSRLPQLRQIAFRLSLIGHLNVQCDKSNDTMAVT